MNSSIRQVVTGRIRFRARRGKGEAVPVIENLKTITDMQTGKSFTCTAVTIDMPQDWRTAITPALGRHGGVDAHGLARDLLNPRTISVTLVHTYGPGESYKTVINALEAVITRGNPLELTFVEEDDTAWLFEHVRLSKYDKKMNKDMARLCTIPLVFTAPDPRQRTLYDPGIRLLNTGLYLDNGFYLDDNANTYSLTGATNTPHYLVNTGTATDEAPIITLVGPITGKVTVAYYDEYRTSTGFYLFADYGGMGVRAGETVTVDAEQPEVTSTLDGTTYAPAGVAIPVPTAYSRFVPFANQEGWGRIAPGNNTVVVQYTSVTSPASASIRWFPRK